MEQAAPRTRSDYMSAHAAAHSHDHHHHHDDVVYPATIPFVLVHLACFAVIWTGFTTTAVVMAVVLYLVRMWALTAGFHRYFSHRTYKTSRWFQFVLAFLGQTSAQRGVIWWSALHRHHHRHSDTPEDVHSPVHGGFFHSHVGWIFKPKRTEADYSTVKDLTQYPELRFLNKHPYFPAFLLAVACFLIAGWPGLIIGFFWSTVALFHGVFLINSMAHGIGKQRYVTGDESRNNWLLALVTLGEGWHNNHHHYQSSTRQGFHWWEIDISYYVLKMLSGLGLVWDLREPPAAIVRGDQRLGRKVIEKVADDLAWSFPLEALGARVRDAWSHKPSLAEIRGRAENARADLAARLSEVHVPDFPTRDELQHRAAEMYRNAPSVDEIVDRADEIIRETVARYALQEARAGR
jgi:stearoyl-CoA desaturase (Delta-9 desaturase)